MLDTKLGRWMGLALLLGMAAPAAPAQTTNVYSFGRAPSATAPAVSPAAPPAAPARHSTAELEKLAAPIAIYPDPLIAIILPASVYPVEIVQAARFVKDTNNIPLLDQQPWDEKVRMVARIPEVITKMDADLAWTVDLGQAFLNQPMELMEAIQTLRAKAQAVGNLKTTAQQVVVVTNAIVERTYESQIVYVTNTVIQIQPASPQVVYVPNYNPSVIYVDNYHNDAAAAVVSFGMGMAFGAAMWGHCDWYYGGCYWGRFPPPPPPRPPLYHPPWGVPPPPPGTRPPGMMPPGQVPPPGTPGWTRSPGATAQPQPATGGSQRWQPDQSRLSSAGAPNASTRQSRGWGSTSGASPSTGVVSPRPSTGVTPNPTRQVASAPTSGRPTTPSTTSRPATTPAPSRPTSTGMPRVPYAPTASPTPAMANRSAFGMYNGATSRSYSNRGSISRSGGFSGGGMSGGFGGGRGGGGRR